MFDTVSVTVSRPSSTSTVDDMGEPVAGTPYESTVAGVLYDPSATSNLSESLRMLGYTVNADFHFPKSYTETLAGCSVKYEGHTYEVIGDIRRYQSGNTPTPWNGVVAAKEVVG